MEKACLVPASEPKAGQFCQHHPSDAVKFLCRTCNTLVCRTCVAHEAHRSHKYVSIVNASAKERQAIEDNLRITKQKLSGLRGSIFWVNDMKSQVEARALEAEKEIDSFISQNIATLERKRAQLKKDVALLREKKVQQLTHQKETLKLVLEQITSGVNYTEQVLKEITDVEVITMKGQFLGLLEFDQVGLQWEPCRTSNFCIEVDRSVAVDTIVDKMAHISDNDIQTGDQYFLTMLGSNSDAIFTARCQQSSFFVVMAMDAHSRVNKVGVNLVDVEITPPENKGPQKITMGSKDDHYTFSYFPDVQGTHLIQVSVAGQKITKEPICWKVDPAVYILDTQRTFLSPEVFEKEEESLTGCWFKHGWHSWQVRILAPDKMRRPPVSLPFEFGVTDGNRTWHWNNGRKYYPNSAALVSTMGNWQCGDILLFYLDLDFKQLVVYNQRSNEMDTWNGISVPIRPYINPQSAEYFGVK